MTVDNVYLRSFGSLSFLASEGMMVVRDTLYFEDSSASSLYLNVSGFSVPCGESVRLKTYEKCWF